MALSRYDIECLQAAKELILKDLSRHYTIREIALHANLGVTKLKNGFREFYSFGLFEYLEIHRLEKAKEMMAGSDKSLKEISKAVGFEYRSNFSRAFKRKYGKPPISWRKSLHTILIIIEQILQLMVKISSISII